MEFILIMNRFLIVAVILLTIFTATLLVREQIDLSPDPTENKNDLISCVSFKLDKLPVLSEFGPIEIGSSLTNDEPNDCVIWSLALNDYILNPAISLQDWYSFIIGCAMFKKWYIPQEGVDLSDIPFVEEICKARLSAIGGHPETFTRSEATPANPNPLSCPPFNVDEQVIIIIGGLAGFSDDPDFVGPVQLGGHAVTCNIVSCLFPANQMLHCSDRLHLPNGLITSLEYDLSINSVGEVISQTPMTDPNLVGGNVVAVHRPEI